MAQGNAVKFQKVSTPFIDETKIALQDFESPGELAENSASMIMKLLWLCRMSRWDLLRQICLLAGHVSKWTVACDKMLHRVMCYLYHTLDHCLSMTVGDFADKWEIKLFSDADLAKCPFTKRSTSGIYAEITGPNTVAPVVGHSSKQGSMSESTPEAELVAAAKAIRSSGIPLLDLLEAILGRKVTLTSFEDNEATEAIIKNGYSPALRHMGRVHGVSIGRVHECYYGDEPIASIRHADTTEMKADIFTKSFNEVGKWLYAVAHLGIGKPKE